MNNSILVDASYIHKMFQEDGIIGKGRDFIHGLPCSIQQMTKLEDQSRYALQIFENLGPEMMEIKVNQLQKAMTENLNPYTMRIVMLGQREINQKQMDLYILYELLDFKTMLIDSDRLDEETAKTLLEGLCKNIILAGRFTNEFLDISPQNIFINESKNELFWPFVISNFGITYKGSKFHRQYTTTSDPFYKENKSLTNIIQTYAFQAAMVTLCAMTKVNSNEFFFEDGQFDSYLMRDYLKLLRKLDEGKQKNETKTEKEKKEQIIKTILKKLPSLGKQENPFEQKYSIDFLGILDQLLQLQVSKRSIFGLLVSYPENMLKVKYPYFPNCPDNKQLYIGCGQLQDEQVIQQECGQDIVDKNKYYGGFKDGKPFGIGCIEIRTNKSLTFVLKNVENSKNTYIMEMDKYLYIGEFNQVTYLPEKIGTCIMVQNQLKNKKQTAIYYMGSFEKGIKTQGIEYYKGKNDFNGEFIDNQPSKGIMTYTKDHFFEGTFENMQKKTGALYMSNLIFEGQFKNDQAKQGIITYSDGGTYEGQFEEGERSGFGKYIYPGEKIKYEGQYKNNLRHGKGQLFDIKNEETLDVEYIEGRCIKPDKLPDSFKLLLQPIKSEETPKPKEEPKKSNAKQQKQQKQDDDEEIPEDIDQNMADDQDQPDLDENYDDS